MDPAERRFDWTDGWTLERAADGAVRIAKRDRDRGLVAEVVIPAHAWASAVAAVSARGSSEHTLTLALGFHQLPAPESL